MDIENSLLNAGAYQLVTTNPAIEFSKFQKKFRKKYKNKDIAFERFKIFKQNLNLIVEANQAFKKGLKPYTLQVNAFSDLVKTEI